jgi:hypothetical protein
VHDLTAWADLLASTIALVLDLVFTFLPAILSKFVDHGAWVCALQELMSSEKPIGLNLLWSLFYMFHVNMFILRDDVVCMLAGGST